MCKLRSYDVNPPGNYSYIQTEGIRREFPALPDIGYQAKLVADFRAGNRLPRPSVQECIEDISAFTCARLGCHRSFCTDDGGAATMSPTSPLVAAPQIAGAPCAGCGAQL